MLATNSVEVFVSYSHQDEELRIKLGKHLKVLEHRGLINCWNDRKIIAGQDWAAEIDSHAKSAHVILLLVSADFISSDYCYQIEMKEALKRHDAREAIVIPIILRAVLWRGTLIGKLQALPKDATPAVAWPSLDDAFVNVTEGVSAAIVAFLKPREPEEPVHGSEPFPGPHRIPLAAQPSVARTGIEALIELMKNDPRVRDEVVKFKSDFATVSAQIDVLADYKDLHDLLHELQIHAFNVIIREARHFPEDEARQNLGEYERRLGMIVERLDVVTARPTFPANQVSWMPNLREARQELAEAIDGPITSKLTNAIEMMRTILAKQPSRVDMRMTAKAEELRLKNLVEAMNAINSKVTWHDLNLDKVSEFREGALEIAHLDAKLHELIEKHNCWQEVDDQLRLIEQFLDEDIKQLAESWPKLQSMFEPLYGATTDPRSAEFRAEGVKLTTALKDREPFKTRQSFRRFRGHGTDRFYEVDKNLRDHCGELRAVGIPLLTILNIL